MADSMPEPDWDTVAEQEIESRHDARMAEVHAALADAAAWKRINAAAVSEECLAAHCPPRADGICDWPRCSVGDAPY